MKFEYTKLVVAALWVLALCAVGLTVNVPSVFAWIALAVLALLPPIVMMRLWKHPAQSTSQSIREAIR